MDKPISNFDMPDLDNALNARAKHECQTLHEALRQAWLAPYTAAGVRLADTSMGRDIEARSHMVARDLLVEHLYARVILLEQAQRKAPSIW